VLFDRLLALDHSRAEPWGPLHAVTVTCYRLQHPATCAVGQEEPMLDLLRTYRDGGLEALHRWTEAARRSNTHRRRAARSTPESSGLDSGPTAQPPASRPDRPARFETTIADVAVDGTFPAQGFADRMRTWAQATIRAWRM